MEIAALSTLSSQVLAASFGLSLCFGVIASKTHFCTMGAISDWVNFNGSERLRQWALAVGVAMCGFAWLAYGNYINSASTLYATARWQWLSALVGGLLFGFGMVLASGCAAKTLVRAGAGSLKALVVLLVLGIAAFATLKGITGVLRAGSVDMVALDMPFGVSLGQWLAARWGLASTSVSLVLGLGLGCGLMLWALWASDGRSADTLLAGFGIGLLVCGMWWVSGVLGFVPEHPLTLQETFLTTRSGRAEALSFVAPVADALDWLMFFSDKSKTLTFGVVSVVGVLSGSWLFAISAGTFRWEGFASTEDVANHLIGAVLMGVGGVTAMGCTIGQGLSGLSTLSLTSFVAAGAIFAGAVLGLKYQQWRINV